MRKRSYYGAKRYKSPLPKGYNLLFLYITTGISAIPVFFLNFRCLFPLLRNRYESIYVSIKEDNIHNIKIIYNIVIPVEVISTLLP